jgi:biofilm protein TabA
MYKNIFNCNFQVLFILFVLGMSFTQCSKIKEKKRDHILMDRLEQAEQYYEMHPAFKEAFAFLNNSNLSELPIGKHEIDGDRLFCLISKSLGRSRAEAKLEAHRKYIDIQYIISGNDEMGWSPTAICDSIDEEYDVEKDIEFFNNEPINWTRVPSGSFVIFFPEDAHAPMVGNEEIHKVVVKIKLEQ